MNAVGRLREAFAAYNAGDLDPVEALFAPHAQWQAVEGRGSRGDTPI